MLRYSPPDRFLASSPEELGSRLYNRALERTLDSIYGNYFHFLFDYFIRLRFDDIYDLSEFKRSTDLMVDTAFADDEERLFICEGKSSPRACNQSQQIAIAEAIETCWKKFQQVSNFTEFVGVRFHDYGTSTCRITNWKNHSPYNVLEGSDTLKFCTGREDAYRIRFAIEDKHGRLKKALKLFRTATGELYEECLTDCGVIHNKTINFEAWNEITRRVS